MSRPTHAACRASLEPMGWVVREPVTAIYALTTGPASHIGDDLACLIAQNLSLYLR
jgi:hypothetical protein